MNKAQSVLFRLSGNDVVKGFITAVASALVLAVYQFVSNGGVSAIEWNSLLDVGVVAGLGYLVKNFFSDGQGKFGGVI